MPKSTTAVLLLIDPQNSFCCRVPDKDQQRVHDGELFVPGAWDDMVRVARLIARLGRKLGHIHVTLNSRQLMHVSHPSWFRDANGRQPEPFTIMSERSGTIVGSRFGDDGLLREMEEYTTAIPALLKRTLDYLRKLAEGKRFSHCIWPPHCLIGSPGHGVVAPIMQALLDWCQQRLTTVGFRTRGSNPFVEHFSAVRAEVPDPDDPTTQMDTMMIQELMEADEILIAGEPGSHTVANTVFDIGHSCVDESFFRRCVLLADATSPLPGYERHQAIFIEMAKAHGMRAATCTDYCM